MKSTGIVTLFNRNAPFGGGLLRRGPIRDQPPRLERVAQFGRVLRLGR
jgi:hypothetical protein